MALQIGVGNLGGVSIAPKFFLHRLCELDANWCRLWRPTSTASQMARGISWAMVLNWDSS